MQHVNFGKISNICNVNFDKMSNAICNLAKYAIYAISSMQYYANMIKYNFQLSIEVCTNIQKFGFDCTSIHTNIIEYDK